MSSRPNSSDKLETSDQFVVWKGSCTDYRVIPLDIVIQAILDKLPKPEFITPVIQRLNPNNNFTVNVESNESGTYLVMNPSIAIDSGWIILPELNSLVDGQELLVSCTEQVTNLTIDGNGAALVGEPNSMGATGFFKLKFIQLAQTWYRVG